MTDNKKPKANAEMDKLEKHFDAYDQHIKDLTQDRMNEAPKLEAEQQTKISQKELEKSNELYLKPKRTISCADKFNEKYREDYNFKKEYVRFIAENKEIIGEAITLWTKPFAGVPAMEWDVPVNKPLWGPRYLAEQIKACSYHRLTMRDAPTSADGTGQFYGQLVVDNTIQRLDAIPVSDKKSIFMGAANF